MKPIDIEIEGQETTSKELFDTLPIEEDEYETNQNFLKEARMQVGKHKECTVTLMSYKNNEPTQVTLKFI